MTMDNFHPNFMSSSSFSPDRKQTKKCENENKRREDENRLLTEIAELLPDSSFEEQLPNNGYNKPDKANILTAAVYYMQAKPKADQVEADSRDGAVQQSQVSSSKPLLPVDLHCPMILEALGFWFIVNSQGKIEYASKNIMDYINYTQEELVGQSIYNIIAIGDTFNFTSRLNPMGNPRPAPDSLSSCTFTCRMRKKDTPDKGIIHEHMQITAVLQTYPVEKETSPSSPISCDSNQSCLVCFARKLTVPKHLTELPKVTTKQDLEGNILACDMTVNEGDHCQNMHVIGKNIYDNCVPNDLLSLRDHHEIVLKQGSNVSRAYRSCLFDSTNSKNYVFVQTKSKLFKNQNTGEAEFIMSTHSIMRECGKEELHGSAGCSLVRSLIDPNCSSRTRRVSSNSSKSTSTTTASHSPRNSTTNSSNDDLISLIDELNNTYNSEPYHYNALTSGCELFPSDDAQFGVDPVSARNFFNELEDRDPLNCKDNSLPNVLGGSSYKNYPNTAPSVGYNGVMPMGSNSYHQSMMTAVAAVAATLPPITAVPQPVNQALMQSSIPSFRDYSQAISSGLIGPNVEMARMQKAMAPPRSNCKAQKPIMDVAPTPVQKAPRRRSVAAKSPGGAAANTAPGIIKKSVTSPLLNHSAEGGTTTKGKSEDTILKQLLNESDEEEEASTTGASATVESSSGVGSLPSQADCEDVKKTFKKSLSTENSLLVNLLNDTSDMDDGGATIYKSIYKSHHTLLQKLLKSNEDSPQSENIAPKKDELLTQLLREECSPPPMKVLARLSNTQTPSQFSSPVGASTDASVKRSAKNAVDTGMEDPFKILMTQLWEQQTAKDSEPQLDAPQFKSNMNQSAARKRKVSDSMSTSSLDSVGSTSKPSEKNKILASLLAKPSSQENSEVMTINLKAVASSIPQPRPSTSDFAGPLRKNSQTLADFSDAFEWGDQKLKPSAGLSDINQMVQVSNSQHVSWGGSSARSQAYLNNNGSTGSDLVVTSTATSTMYISVPPVSNDVMIAGMDLGSQIDPTWDLQDIDFSELDRIIGSTSSTSIDSNKSRLFTDDDIFAKLFDSKSSANEVSLGPQPMDLGSQQQHVSLPNMSHIFGNTYSNISASQRMMVSVPPISGAPNGVGYQPHAVVHPRQHIAPVANQLAGQTQTTPVRQLMPHQLQQQRQHKQQHQPHEMVGYGSPYPQANNYNQIHGAMLENFMESMNTTMAPNVSLQRSQSMTGSPAGHYPPHQSATQQSSRSTAPYRNSWRNNQLMVAANTSQASYPNQSMDMSGMYTADYSGTAMMPTHLPVHHALQQNRGNMTMMRSPQTPGSMQASPYDNLMSPPQSISKLSPSGSLSSGVTSPGTPSGFASAQGVSQGSMVYSPHSQFHRQYAVNQQKSPLTPTSPGKSQYVKQQLHGFINSRVQQQQQQQTLTSPNKVTAEQMHYPIHQLTTTSGGASTSVLMNQHDDCSPTTLHDSNNMMQNRAFVRHVSQGHYPSHGSDDRTAPELMSSIPSASNAGTSRLVESPLSSPGDRKTKPNTSLLQQLLSDNC